MEEKSKSATLLAVQLILRHTGPTKVLGRQIKTSSMTPHDGVQRDKDGEGGGGWYSTPNRRLSVHWVSLGKDTADESRDTGSTARRQTLDDMDVVAVRNEERKKWAGNTSVPSDE